MWPCNDHCLVQGAGFLLALMHFVLTHDCLPHAVGRLHAPLVTAMLSDLISPVTVQACLLFKQSRCLAAVCFLAMTQVLWQ